MYGTQLRGIHHIFEYRTSLLRNQSIYFLQQPVGRKTGVDGAGKLLPSSP